MNFAGLKSDRKEGAKMYYISETDHKATVRRVHGLYLKIDGCRDYPFWGVFVYPLSLQT